MPRCGSDTASRSPTLLTIPGLCCSGPDHWQTRWEAARPADCRRIELPDWEDPSPDEWAAGIAAAIAGRDGEVVLAAHSLGCHAVAHWSSGASPTTLTRVRGALLVAPPDVERSGCDPRVTRFPFVCGRLPFPAVLVASHDDPWATFDRSRHMASVWGAKLIDVGRLGHINAESGVGDWPAGQQLAGDLLAAGQPR